MRNSSERILTSHAGSLPRPDDLIELNRRRMAGEGVEEEEYAGALRSSVSELVARQKALGVDVPNDGEYGKTMGARKDYGAWWGYAYERLGGVEITDLDPINAEPRRSTPGNIVLTSFTDRRDRVRFRAVYEDPDSGAHTGGAGRTFPTCTGPMTYTGHDRVATDIANVKAALAANGYSEGFITALAPGSCARIRNTHYATQEEFMYACADAMREEYRAILDAGLVLQLDDPGIAENWDQINPEPSVEDYRAFTMKHVEAMNHAIRGLPKDRIRFHLCWGSWHGPHTTDIPMRDIVDCLLAIDVGAYSFEAGNVRHEHEWKVWNDVKLPEGKIILPGVVSHATNVVEHPELVADRIERFAEAVGPENVIASTDCGLGGRIHPDIAWAKLQTLSEGAALASKRLYG